MDVPGNNVVTIKYADSYRTFFHLDDMFFTLVDCDAAKIQFSMGSMYELPIITGNLLPTQQVTYSDGTYTITQYGDGPGLYASVKTNGYLYDVIKIKYIPNVGVSKITIFNSVGLAVKNYNLVL